MKRIVVLSSILFLVGFVLFSFAVEGTTKAESKKGNPITESKADKTFLSAPHNAVPMTCPVQVEFVVSVDECVEDEDIMGPICSASSGCNDTLCSLHSSCPHAQPGWFIECVNDYNARCFCICWEFK